MIRHSTVLGLALLVSLSLARESSADIVGFHQTAGGKVVDLSGLQWLEWTTTTGLSRTQMETELLPGGTYEDWRYASRAEVGALMDSVWGGTVDGWDASNRDGGDWLAANFGSVFGGVGGMDFHFGSNAEVGASTFWGHFRGGGGGSEGWLHDDWGLTTGADAVDNQATNSKSVSGPTWGHALVRADADPVPEPGTFALFGAAALGAYVIRRRRKAS